MWCLQTMEQLNAAAARGLGYREAAAACGIRLGTPSSGSVRVLSTGSLPVIVTPPSVVEEKPAEKK